MPAVTPWTEVGDRIWVRAYRPFLVNVTAIDVGSGVVAVDTRGSLDQGRELRNHLAELGAGPLVAVVNTHEHFDHTFGNGAFPGVPCWAHRRCAQRLREHGEDQREQTLSWIPEEGHAELRASPIVPPDHLFDETTSVDVGDRVIELRHVGRGHTDNDILVLVSDAGTMIAGDLVEEAGPPAYGDAFPRSWPATLERVLGLVTGPVVPGHGATGDRAFVADQLAIVTEVAERARRHVELSVPVGELLEDPPVPEPMLRIALDRARVEAGH